MNNLKVVAGGSTPSLVTLEIGEIPQSKQQLKAFVMTMETKENRWNEPFTAALRKALKYVKDHADASVLITKSSSPKFFSNGLDLANLNVKDRAFMSAFGKEVMGTFADVLDLPIPTICLLQGHAFGAGMMIALAHDYRIQMAGRGFMCANEIELNMPIPKPELDLFSHAMASPDFYETVLAAKRWDGTESVRRGLVHATGNEQEIQTALIALCNRVAHLGVNRANMGKFKRDTKGYVADGLRNFYDAKL